MNKELEQLIRENEKLILSFIKNYNNYVDKEDLKQVGVIGLIKAYENYKKDSGIKFTTYAYKSIHGEIKKYLRENRNFKINKDTKTLCNKINQAKILLEQRLMKEPTLKELSEFLEMDESKVSMLIGIQDIPQSLDKKINTKGKEVTLYDVIGNDDSISQIEKIELYDEINKLSYEDKRLLQERYFNDRTQSEVAKILGLSQVKVSRQEKKVLQKLKDSLIA